MKISSLLKERSSAELLKGVVRRIFRLTGLNPAGAETSAPLLATLDLPVEHELCQWYIHVCGWAFSRSGAIDRITASLDGIDLGPVPYGAQRIDVHQAIPEMATDRCGFNELFVPPAGIKSSAVAHKLLVVVRDTAGNTREFTRSIRLQPAIEKLIPALELAMLPQIEVNEHFPIVPSSRVSVVIPTLNAGEEFTSLLSSLKSQIGIEHLEIIVVDSGSTDRTPVFAREYGARVHSIKPEEFSHSAARNAGADLATGNYLLFMTQDAMPGSFTWLAEILYAMQNNHAVAATCLESPRSDTDLFYQAITWGHRRFLNADAGDRILRLPAGQDYESLRKNSQLCNIACVIDHATFRQYRFRCEYAEDLDLGLRLIRDGKQLLLLDSLPVIHSHHRNAYYYLRRGYVDAVWMSKLFDDYPLPPVLQIADLCTQMIDSHEAFVHFAQGLAMTKFPCPAQEYVAEAKSLLEKPVARSLPDLPMMVESEDPYRALLQKLAQYCSSLPAPAAADPLLYNAVRDSLQPFWLYVSQTFEWIDSEVSVEIEQSMFKMHGLIAGGFWASHFAKYPAPLGGIALQVKNEIGRGV